MELRPDTGDRWIVCVEAEVGAVTGASAPHEVQALSPSVAVPHAGHFGELTAWRSSSFSALLP
jgi:hypothetical protein